MAGGAEEEREELDEDELEQEEQAVAAAGRPKQTRRKKSRMVGPLWRLEGMQVARACLHAPLPAPADRPAPPRPRHLRTLPCTEVDLPARRAAGKTAL